MMPPVEPRDMAPHVPNVIPDNSQHLVLTLQTPVKEQLSKLAQEHNLSESELAEEVIEAFVDKMRFAESVREGLHALDEGRSVPLSEFRDAFRKRMAARLANR